MAPRRAKHKPAHKTTRSKDPSGRRIAHRVQVKPWYRRRPIVQAAVMGAILMIGVGLGTGLGIWLGPDDGPRPMASTALQMPPLEDIGLPEGSPLPVIVQGSDQAKRLYEESLAAQPDPVRPDPNAGPDSVREPAPQVASYASPLPVPPVSERIPEQPASSVDIPQVAPLRPVAEEPWQTYAVAVAPADGRPRIAIVFDDLGIDQTRSRKAMALPGPLTMAFLPYGYHLKELVSDARRNGHEILVHMPMAPLDLSVDPGPNALQKELGPSEIIRRLDWNLDQIGGYVGINNHMGSRFTADRDGMRLVMAELKRRGLLFVDSITTTDSQGYKVAAESGVPYAVRDVFLDHVIDTASIRKQLQRVEETARRTGHAIAIGHPHDETLAVVGPWLKTIEAKGFQLVPVSAIVRDMMPVARS
ncbi:divergent polysaccharide deacetylase family protein [Rhodospirillaceae bacterium KN72]|uniref:Divergent polysaccharide deacetylase family protein n=1 Tax=Pacificispira spongiicola TaxID=2729598 RepID=A0A7Y0DYL8_9PROT|nr:divergent polysaccharide deacetylase family protein [Pacificispira spongiicola]NMM44014.1 divergent polysaccharide deacetylase family protein [Pacificispira spongiicola]